VRCYWREMYMAHKHKSAIHGAFNLFAFCIDLAESGS
jgi:hypothetical protein